MTHLTTIAPAASLYADVLPPWLNYLVAAYPTAKLAANTLPVFEDAFGDEDPAVMRSAARAAVREYNFFPTVHELARCVRNEHERGEQESFIVPAHLHYRRQSALWPACPDCGERVNPEWDSCPACDDLARMAPGVTGQAIAQSGRE